MEKKKFSIIVPVYNCEKYLERCIESVINQTYKYFELILVNDGSTDRSGVICDSYSKRDKRIKVIHKENGGVSSARNEALKIIKGDYVCFLDADDYIDNDFFKEAMELFKKYPNVEWISFGFFSDVENENKIISSDKINYINKMYNSREEIKEDFVSLWDNTVLYNIVNKVFLRKIIEENSLSFSNDYFGEDVKFNRTYLDRINSFYNSEKCFYHYIREREGAVTKRYKSDFFEIRKKEFFEFNDYFEKWNIEKKDYYEYSCRRYIERILGCIENIFCSKMKFKQKHKEVKKIINDPVTRETIKYAKPKSKKIKIILIPIKFKMTLITMLMGKIFNLVKTKFPSLFNKLKNRR